MSRLNSFGHRGSDGNLPDWCTDRMIDEAFGDAPEEDEDGEERPESEEERRQMAAEDRADAERDERLIEGDRD